MPARLTQLQLDVMHVLWDRGESTVAEVQEELAPERNLAYSTVSTVLSRLEERGQVAHRTEGRTYVYRAKVSEEKVGRSMMGDLVGRVFGSPSELVSQLLDSEHVDADELGRIKELIEQHEAAQQPSRRKKRHDR